jgi:hypothetical protein
MRVLIACGSESQIIYDRRVTMKHYITVGAKFSKRMGIFFYLPQMDV